MLGVDVRHHRDRWVEQEEAPVALVGFGDQEGPLPEPRVCADRTDPAPDDHRRVEPAVREKLPDHRRGRCLPMRPGDGDRVLDSHQLGEHLRARNHRDGALVRAKDFRIRFRDRRRGNDHVGPFHLVGTMANEDARAERTKPRHRFGFLHVRSRHLVAQIQKHLRDPAHSASANPHEVNPTNSSVHANLAFTRDRARMDELVHGTRDSLSGIDPRERPRVPRQSAKSRLVAKQSLDLGG